MQALLQHTLARRLRREVSEEEWRELIGAVIARRANPYEVADGLARRVGLDPSHQTGG